MTAFGEQASPAVTPLRPGGNTEMVARRLLRILRDCDGYGFDTYDARVGSLYVTLNERRYRSRLSRLLLKILYVVEMLAPVAYRRLRGIRPNWDPMGNSYRAGAYLSFYLADGNEACKAAARDILDRVASRSVGPPGARGFALGFPCVTGSAQLWSTEIPVAHYTLRVARKMLIWERIVGDGRYAASLDEVARCLTEVLPWVRHDGWLGVGYTPADPLQVVNIWADVASFLASYDAWRGSDTHRANAIGLAHSVLAHQSADATWPYFASWETMSGEVDNSHTAMVLGALADLAACYPDDLQPRISAALEAGASRWVDLFFDEDSGRHWALLGARHIASATCLGDTLYAIHRLVRPATGLSTRLVDRLTRLSERVVAWSLANLLRRDGRFLERKMWCFGYSVRGVRTFDGLVCDSLALHLAARTVAADKRNLLWTI